MATAVRTAQSEDTVSVTTTEEAPSPAVVLKLRKPQSDHRVRWTEETVDNEHMGKKSSKCCCIYEKPKVFGESSDSESSDSDDNSYEKKTKKERAAKKKARKHQHDCDNHDHSHASDEPGPST